MNVWEIADLEHFNTLVLDVGQSLLNAPRVDGNNWQSTNARKEMLTSYELRHVMLQIPMTAAQEYLATSVGANMPWAEDHFKERVGGLPLNPPPSEAWWPYAVQGNAEHKEQTIFSHTYPERFWPKRANIDPEITTLFINSGIRYEYGDLWDVVAQLIADPRTRQAYLPVWFPEDTGATGKQRVPCTLGYHFLWRGDVMDITYHIRSCDFIRHWQDDIYMAGRLLQWVCRHVLTEEGPSVRPGKLVMNIGSLHIFDGDRVPLGLKLDQLRTQIALEKSERLSRALG